MANGVLAIVNDVQRTAECVLQCVGKARNQTIATATNALLDAINADITCEDTLVLLPLALGFVEIN